MRPFGLLTLTLLVSTSHLVAQDIPLSKILVDKQGWREVAKKWPKVTFLNGGETGTVDIYQGAVKGSLNPDGSANKVDGGVSPFDYKIVLSPFGTYVVTEEQGKKVVALIHPAKKKSIVLNLPGLNAPSCLTMWPDRGHLVIGESDGAYLWAVRIEKDGGFGPGDRYYSLRTKPNEKMHVAAMVMDAGYLLYACTPLGIQVFDPTGRLSGVVAAPSKDAMSAITIGGAKADELFVAAGDRIFARRIQGKASYTIKK